MIMNLAKVYRVGGVTFEWHTYFGPTIINRHTNVMRDIRNISRRNWAMIAKFCQMTDAQKEDHRIY